MPDTELQPGDVVRLKSGGPLMTVTDVVEAGESVDTTWFTDAGDDRGARYPATAVRRASNAQPTT